MLDLKRLNVAAAAARGTVVELESPEDGSPLLDADGMPYFIEVLGEDSAKVREVERNQADRRAEKLRRGNIDASLKQEALEKDRVERLIAATVRWYLPPLDADLSTDPTPFTPANARLVYGDDAWAWIPEQVEKAMRDRTRFFSTGSTR